MPVHQPCWGSPGQPCSPGLHIGHLQDRRSLYHIYSMLYLQWRQAQLPTHYFLLCMSCCTWLLDRTIHAMRFYLYAIRPIPWMCIYVLRHRYSRFNGSFQHIKMNKRENRAYVFVCLTVRLSLCASVRMFMGVLVAAHGGWANLLWFSTVCCYSRLRIHWIGNECALRALQTTTMPRQSMRKTDRQTDTRTG